MECTLTITYQLVSCALSPLEAEGFPFALLLGETKGRSTRLSGFALLGWRELTGLFPDEIHEAIELFLSDVKALTTSPSEENTRFLESLVDLSMGPVRAFASGVCEYGDLVNTVNSKMATLEPQVIWPGSFIAL